MSEPLTQDLRDLAAIIDSAGGLYHMIMLNGDIFNDAADEIERLRKRLQLCQSADSEPLTDGCITQNERFLLAEVERLRSERETYRNAHISIEHAYHAAADEIERLYRAIFMAHDMLMQDFPVTARMILGDALGKAHDRSD